ncbi:MAG: hypothetical protein ACWGNB_09770 [Thiogranum sp.]
MLEITIEGGIEAATSVYRVDPEVAPETAPDTATLLQRAPGANVNRNGPLTGIAQYRGMFGQRVNALVDGNRRRGLCRQKQTMNQRVTVTHSWV